MKGLFRQKEAVRSWGQTDTSVSRPENRLPPAGLSRGWREVFLDAVTRAYGLVWDGYCHVVSALPQGPSCGQVHVAVRPSICPEPLHGGRREESWRVRQNLEGATVLCCHPSLWLCTTSLPGAPGAQAWALRELPSGHSILTFPQGSQLPSPSGVTECAGSPSIVLPSLPWDSSPPRPCVARVP